MLEIVLPIFYSSSFIVSGLTFRSLIHSEFIFVCGIRKCYSFILLQMIDQFSQHYLLKRFFFLHYVKEIVFSPLYIFASFVKCPTFFSKYILKKRAIEEESLD